MRGVVASRQGIPCAIGGGEVSGRGCDPKVFPPLYAGEDRCVLASALEVDAGVDGGAEGGVLAGL